MGKGGLVRVGVGAGWLNCDTYRGSGRGICLNRGQCGGFQLSGRRFGRCLCNRVCRSGELPAGQSIALILKVGGKRLGGDRSRGCRRVGIRKVGVQRLFQARQRVFGVGGGHEIGDRFRCRCACGFACGFGGLLCNRGIAVQDRHGFAVAVHAFAGRQGCLSRGSRAKPWLADETAVFRDGDKGNRVQPVSDGKSLSLVQRLAGDDGDLDRGPFARPVKHQILNRIGGAPLKPRGDLATLVVAAGSGGVNLGVKDLAGRQHDLDGHAHRRQAKRGLAQIVHGGVKVGGVEGNLANRQPTLRRPVQKRDDVARQVECKCRFHDEGLARYVKARERAPRDWRRSIAAFRRKKEKRPRIGL